MTKTTKKRDMIPITVRIPDDLHERIHKADKVSGRSINAEILYRIEHGMLARPTDAYTDGDLIKELIDRYPIGAVKIEIK